MYIIILDRPEVFLKMIVQDGHDRLNRGETLQQTETVSSDAVTRLPVVVCMLARQSMGALRT